LELDLSGRRAIVTGAARGIGRVIAEQLAACGAEVHGLDMALPQDQAGDISFHVADISDTDGVAEVIAQISGPVSILVNNAGITRDRTLMKMSNEEWTSVIDVNLTGAFNMIHSVAPLMIEAQGASIINITSINGLRGKVGQGNYAAAKAGLIGLSKTAARELGRKGITVNAVAPGMVLTEMARVLPAEILERATGETVLNKLAEPIDIANAVVFLASDAARMITGQVLQVDAGQLI